jgi:flagellar M-ring protein FliF
LIKNIVLGVAAAAFLITLLIVFFRRKKDKLAGDKPTLDVVVGDGIEGIGATQGVARTVIPKQPVVYDPILDTDEEDIMNLQKELQSYASKKPDQVVEVIKTWLTEDER